MSLPYRSVRCRAAAARTTGNPGAAADDDGDGDA
jgi:hypothetical protein